MDAGAQPLRAELERGRVSVGTLEAVGEPDPAKAFRAFERALGHPDLAGSRQSWTPRLLLTARPGFGAQCLEELANRYRQTRRRGLELTGSPTLPAILGSSDFLARLLLRHPHWAEELVGDPPPAPEPEPIQPDWTAIRIAKYRGLLRIAARDLAGRPFPESLRELSELADRCLIAALAAAADETDTSPPTLLALGKLGGRELNFSSDVDLLFIYAAEPGRGDLERSRQVGRLIHLFKGQLEVASEDGFAYRVDLDLRPEGRSGALANSVDAALRYYEVSGAEWERQMLMRLRHVAGPAAPAQVLTTAVLPFVYRRRIDPESIRSVRDMKRRIEAEHRERGRDLEADLKLGPGGIRDVEFLVQALQLFHGGRLPEIRTGNVLEALIRLRTCRLLPEAVIETLREAYGWLRRAEHAVQLVEERQTHRFPRDARQQLALARRMGYADLEGTRARDRLLGDWSRVRSRVREAFTELILEPDDGPDA